MRFCIQNAVNTMEMKDSRSGSRGPYHWGGWGGLRDQGPGYVCVCPDFLTQNIGPSKDAMITAVVLQTATGAIQMHSFSKNVRLPAYVA